MIVDFLRHGSTGRRDRLDGLTDPPLDAEGWDEMRRQTADGGWAAVWASPRIRAQAPARAVAERLALALTVDAGWAEMDFGAWDGLKRAEIAAELAAFHADPVAHGPPDGTTWADFEARVRAALARLLATSAPGERGAPVLVVTHAGPMRMALALACGLPFDRLWCLRITTGTRIRLQLGRDGDGGLWGEIIEVAQP